jgi:DNA-binding protein HU-beta
MKKNDLIATIAEKAQVSRVKVANVLDALPSVLSENLSGDEPISFPGLGKFSITHKESREARNPATGKKVTVPAKDVPTFKFSASFKDLFK